jgi:transketolase
MASQSQINSLRRQAADLRLRIVRMMGAGKAHHFGGSLSAAEIITALYFYKMRYDPANPKWPDRDRFIMSKGHSVPAQYAALAMLGVFPLEELATLKRLGSPLQGHPAMHHTPGIEACTGALGEGLSFANGVALAARLAEKSYRVYCLLGDGELHEGQVWEAAMTAVKHCLDNLVAIIDRNRLKAMDATECGKLLNPLAQRWSSFGWAVREVDGHDMAALCEALDWADGQVRQPSMIIANTVKGQGVSFMAGQAGFHNASLTEEQYRQAVAELDLALKEQTL